MARPMTVNNRRRRTILARTILAVASVALGLITATGPVAACQGPPIPFAATTRDADRIVVVQVLTRIGTGYAGPWTYEFHVERVVKGGALPDTWTVRGAGASDCGMPRLDPGGRFVLEYRDLETRNGKTPWFFAWQVLEDGTVTPAEFHKGPFPATLDELIAKYESLPATSTVALTSPSAGSVLTDPTGPVPAAFLLAGGAGLLAAAGWCLAMRRRGRRRSAGAQSVPNSPK